jgi:hypothetical protein
MQPLPACCCLKPVRARRGPVATMFQCCCAGCTDAHTQNGFSMYTREPQQQQYWRWENQRWENPTLDSTVGSTAEPKMNPKRIDAYMSYIAYTV